MELRWTYRWELHHLLNLCGLAVDVEYSDFATSAPAYGKELIVVARAGELRRALQAACSARLENLQLTPRQKMRRSSQRAKSRRGRPPSHV